ncbi:MAG: hypothetical protein AB7V16_02525 [Vulcanibacillus sp.]
MKLNKIIVLITILALALSIVGCSSSTPAPAPTPAPEAPAPTPAPEAPAAAAPAPAAEAPAFEYDQIFVDNVTPKLQAMVDAGTLTAERMQDVIARIKTGEYTKTFVQKILSGDEK